MDLAVSIAIGSCIQIALFVAPLLVLLSYVAAPRPLVLLFPSSEAARHDHVHLGDRRRRGDRRREVELVQGVQLVVVYALIALLAYFVPM